MTKPNVYVSLWGRFMLVAQLVVFKDFDSAPLPGHVRAV
jgi:hypothetical protein